MSKAKKKERQDARAVKDMEDILSGRVKVGTHEKPKKRAQANRVGGAGGKDGPDELVESYLRLLRHILPGILVLFSKLKDPRTEAKTTHTLPLLMLYGIIMFLSHTPSRRAANREIGGSKASELMKWLLDEFKTIPHADTLARLLAEIEENSLEEQYEELIRLFIKSGTFKEINPGRFLVFADGSHKFTRKYEWDGRTLSRNAGDIEKEKYFASMLESVLLLPNGMLIPLLTEPMENGESLDGNGKQDCESKAFKRLAERLEGLLGKGCVTIVLDGLYATGPIISICRNNGWEFMISLKSDCLKSVWEDFDGLRKIETDNTYTAHWGDRLQQYQWSNGIEYIYGNNHKKLLLNVVECIETWVEPNPRKKGKPPTQKQTYYAWLSSERVTEQNVFKLCAQIARGRWRIENHFLVVKHQGLQYSHCFSYNWNAMKGFHVLAKFANFINTLILFSESMSQYICAESMRYSIEKAWKVIIYAGTSEKIGSSVSGLASSHGGRCHIPFSNLKIKIKPAG
jgi:hypothetical protein